MSHYEVDENAGALAAQWYEPLLRQRRMCKERITYPVNRNITCESASQKLTNWRRLLPKDAAAIPNNTEKRHNLQTSPSTADFTTLAGKRGQWFSINVLGGSRQFAE